MQPLLGERKSSGAARKVAATVAVGVALVLAAVAVVDLQGKGAHAVELVEVVQGPANLAGRRIVIARGNMLMDAALEPLYTEGEPIAPYSWVGAHKADYDAEAQNAWGNLAMERDDIKDPDDEFRGIAAKDMSKAHHVPDENVWDYLPAVEAKSMSTKAPHEPDENAWSDMTLDY